VVRESRWAIPGGHGIFGTVSRAPEASYDEFRARVVNLMTSMDRAPVIGISGHGGAGKSTLAARLMTDLGGTPEQVIGTDGFYAVGAGPRSGLFDLHDWAALYELLHGIRATQDLKRLTYSVRTYSGADGTCDVPMPPVVLVEGIRLFRSETMIYLDMAGWIDLAPEPAGRRAVERNRDQGDSSEELDLWRTKWIPEAHEYARLVCPERLADVLIAAAGNGTSATTDGQCARHNVP
jgi:uridine kinase